ncbi:hypothetical protein GCM10009759_15860 [Kitasatospora saccharophila]|uniref:Uncharacterized protein n=1 Tax=Kitasatospora saccharophila TaxID=407973 RepID=A0ABN2WFN6_9ACTN
MSPGLPPLGGADPYRQSMGWYGMVQPLVLRRASRRARPVRRRGPKADGRAIGPPVACFRGARSYDRGQHCLGDGAGRSERPGGEKVEQMIIDCPRAFAERPTRR